MVVLIISHYRIPLVFSQGQGKGSPWPRVSGRSRGKPLDSHRQLEDIRAGGQSGVMSVRHIEQD